MAAPLHMLLVLVTMVTVAKANLNYLYYTAPGGAVYGELPGFYGAAANYKENASALDYPDSGFQCLDTEKGIKRGFDLRSISMDPKSRKVMLSVKHENDRTVTLATMSLCLAQEHCENATFSPDLLFDNAGLEHAMSPVAYYDSTVYFLVTIEEEGGDGQTNRRIELRMLQGCQEMYPVDVYTSFYVLECSKKIAMIAEEKYDAENSFSPLFVSHDLLVINTGSQSFFLTQLQRVEYDENYRVTAFSMELMLVKNKTGEVVSLHQETLDVDFRRFVLQHIGAINLKNDKLCWSAVDTILCADWANSGSISNVVTILPKGKSSEACLTMPGLEIASSLITGIALAKTDGEFAIYFGCLAQTTDFGGAGLVRLKNGKRSIYSLRVNDTEIFAGSMFMVPDCKPEKPGSNQDGGYGVSAAQDTVTPLFTFLLIIALLTMLS